MEETLLTNFFCHFEVTGEVHSEEGRNIEFRLMQDVPEGEQDTLRTAAAAIERNDGTVHQNGREAPTKSRRMAPDGLGHKITQLYPCLQGIH